MDLPEHIRDVQETRNYVMNASADIGHFAIVLGFIIVFVLQALDW